MPINNNKNIRRCRTIEFLKYMSLITQLGLSMVLPIAGGAFLGQFLAVRFGTGGLLTIFLILLGVFGALMNAYKILTKTYK